MPTTPVRRNPLQHLPQTQRRFRAEVPKEHRASLDTRIQWMWNQRFGTIQTIWQANKDVLDFTAATLVLQAVMGKDLTAIEQLFQRLEGAPINDEDVLERDPINMRL